MKLSLWLYTHRYGTDLLRVLIPDDVKLSGRDVVRLTGIDWEGDFELVADKAYWEEQGGYVSREDEFLEHDVDVPVGDGPMDALLPFVTLWKPESEDE